MSLTYSPGQPLTNFRSTSKTQRVAIICSARSSRTKNEGTTTRLLRAAQAAASNSGSELTFQTIVDEIKDDLRDYLFQQRGAKRFESYVKDLRAKADIKINSLD